MGFELLPIIIARYPFIYFIVISGGITMTFGVLSSRVVKNLKFNKEVLRKAYISVGFFALVLVVIALIFTKIILTNFYHLSELESAYYNEYVDLYFNQINIDLVAIFIFSVTQVIGMSFVLVREILRSKREKDKKAENTFCVIIFIHAFF